MKWFCLNWVIYGILLSLLSEKFLLTDPHLWGIGAMVMLCSIVGYTQGKFE